MMKTGLALGLVLAVAACGTVRESRLNPLNWFGASQGVGPVDTDRNPLIPERRDSILFADEAPEPVAAPPVARVTALEVVARPGGAILRAEGIAPGPAPHEVTLVPDPEAEAGTLGFVLTARTGDGPPGAEAARRVVAALWLSTERLAGIRTIRVAAQEGARVTRR